MFAAQRINLKFSKGFIHSREKKPDLVRELFDVIRKEVLFCDTETHVQTKTKQLTHGSLQTRTSELRAEAENCGKCEQRLNSKRKAKACENRSTL